MTEPMYFQWQNPVLLQTIYPRRNRKLADFLIYCQEIDLWKEYEGKNLSQDEINIYQDEHDDAVVTAFSTFKTEYAYFINENVRTYHSGYKPEDEAEFAPIKEMHSAFKRYLPSYQNVRKEKNLVAWYITSLDQKRKTAEEEVKRLENRRKIISSNHPDQVNIPRALDKLQRVTLPILKAELNRLIGFASAYNRIEKRKLEFDNVKASASKQIPSLNIRLDSARMPLRRLEADRRGISAAITRLRTPPRRDSFDAYFLTQEISDDLCRDFPQADPGLINVISGIHKRLATELRALADFDVKRVRLKNYVDELRSQYNKLFAEINRPQSQVGGRSMDSQDGEKHARRAAGLQVVEMELDKLSDYHAAFEYEKKPQMEMQQEIQKKETELKKLQERISTQQAQVSALEGELKTKTSIRDMDENDYLTRFRPEHKPVTSKDIVRAKVEKYKQELEREIDPDLPQEQVQQKLLERIVQRFLEKPEEYPLWLQYMVIHFSGMRYATAHGSWADPKDLLKSLRTSELQKKFKRIALDPNAVEAMCDERADAYETKDRAKSPKLALTKDEKWLAKIATHLAAIKLPYGKRNALFELLLDEENYEIDSMDPAQALEALRELREESKAEDAIPDWMWKEIVRLTDLRVQEAKDPNWNRLTREEQDQKNEARYAEFREIMNKWKEKNLTGWRAEHDRSNRLIVSSSVCNEVAEQILHLRGRSPGGGLTGLVDWYNKTVNGEKAAGSQEPYFVFAKPGAEESYKPGATILWLRFVYEKPNLWRVAKPMQIGGDRLIPDKYRRNEGKDGEWTYFESDMISRKRTRLLENKRMAKDEQWLRWMHAATIAKVAETADGPIVLTFETALPYDDPSVSAVGVFRHYRPNLMWDGGEDNYNGSFIAYLPEVDIPVKDLEEMLDWNKILRRPVMTPAQLEDYRKKHIRTM